MESALRNLGGKRAASGRSAARAAPAGRPRRGYTLIEVLLSLTLASLVLLAVGMAVDFQLRVVDRSRGNVEEAQLARVLLRRIADDLRCAVTKDPLQMAELVKEFESAADELQQSTTTGTGTTSGGTTGGGGTSGGTTGGGGTSGGTGGGGTGGSGTTGGGTTGGTSTTGGTGTADDSTATESEETDDSSASQSTPGVYGESNWLQVDVGLLPRLDQFDSLYTSIEGATTVDRISDVKTVTYSVLESEDETGYAADGTPSGGLVRREKDRAVSLWGATSGQIDDDSDATPLAPEVTAIAFRYWDGAEWVDSWDSGEAGALPVAVEVTLTIRPIRDPSEVTATNQSVDEDGEEVSLTYSRIVHLLAAEPSSADEASEATDETAEPSEL